MHSYVIKEIKASSTSKQIMTAEANGNTNVAGIEINKTSSCLLVMWTNKNQLYEMQAKHFGCKQHFGQKEKCRNLSFMKQNVKTVPKKNKNFHHNTHTNT